MKKFLFLIILSFSISCIAQNEYGSGVTHSDKAPTQNPRYQMAGHSKTFIDSSEQAFYTNSKKWGWWLLMSPEERYLRGTINVYFSDDETIQFSTIEDKIKVQAGTGRKLNGLYLVKFTSLQGSPIDIGILENMPKLPVNAYITCNDYVLLRYYRNAIQTIERFDDKSNNYYQDITTKIQTIRDSVKLLRDTAVIHRRDIDSLLNRPIGKDTIVSKAIIEKQLVYVPYYNYKCDQKAPISTFGSISAGYDITTFNGYYFACPPSMAGDTIVALQISFCKSSNYMAKIGAVRLRQDGVVQNIFQIPDRDIPANALQKTLTNVLNFGGQHNGVLQENDRIVVYVSAYVRPSGSQAALEEAYGFSATLVVKPKSN